MFSTPFYLDASVLAFGTTEFAFLIFLAAIILRVPRQATVARFTGLVALSALTYMLQETVLHMCRNAHWRAAAVPLAWIQFLSASEMVCVSRVDSACISADHGGPKAQTNSNQAVQVVGLLWNLRRVGTRWQVKNIPVSSSSGSASSSRVRFVLRRLATTFLAYIILDVMVSGPAPDLALVSPQKETLFRLSCLSLDDVVFRTIGTVSFWLSSALINTIMTNIAAIVSVLSGLSSPADCPPLYGSIGEAYSLRRFWG